jgi:Cu/Ag efflux pump CusA
LTSRTSCAAAVWRAHGVDILQLILGASLEVRRPVFYATAAVAVAFLPILMLSGLQGSFFRPLSIAFLLAVGCPYWSR